MIGGGLAGLSSAVALAEAGFRVRLLEKRPHLGGRATSYTLPDGSEVDNCQHVTLGCCTNLADFYRRVGASEKIHFYDRLYFVDATGRRSTIKSSWLPPPLHMAPSFLLFGALAAADKRGIAQALLAIARAGGDPPGINGISMLDWLQRMKQTPAAIERFWRVVLVSALDEELARTDARYGIEVFWKAFLANRKGYRVGIPSVPLAELYDGACDAVLERGGEVRLRCGVREIRLEGSRFAKAVLEDGSEMTADACIAAVPHGLLPDLVPAEWSGPGKLLEGLRHLKTSPITSAHLWFERTVMEEPFLALLDHTTQWIFNKTLLNSVNVTAKAPARLTRERPPGVCPAICPTPSICNWSSALPMIWCRSRVRKSSICAGASWRGSARNARREAPQGHGDQGSERDVFSGARRGPLAASTRRRHGEFILRGRLDAHRLARHDGRRRAQRISRGGSPGRRGLIGRANSCSRTCRWRVSANCGRKGTEINEPSIIKGVHGMMWIIPPGGFHGPEV